MGPAETTSEGQSQRTAIASMPLAGEDLSGDQPASFVGQPFGDALASGVPALGELVVEDVSTSLGLAASFQLPERVERAFENNFGDGSKNSLLTVILSRILDAGGGEVLVLGPHHAGEVEVQVQFADKFHGASFVEPGWRVESELREVLRIDFRAGFRPVERKEGVSAGRVPERGW